MEFDSAGLESTQNFLVYTKRHHILKGLELGPGKLVCTQ